MNYTIEGKNYIANQGYVFISKITGIISKKLRLCKPQMLENYKVIPEPVAEEPKTETEEEL